MALVPETSADKSAREMDMHRWAQERVDCRICNHDRPGKKKLRHAMKCADCGIRRSIGRDHCYEYDQPGQPDKRVYWPTPPCGNKQPDPAVAVFDTVQVCSHCGHYLENDQEEGAGYCRNSCVDRASGKTAAIKKLRVVLSIRKL